MRVLVLTMAVALAGLAYGQAEPAAGGAGPSGGSVDALRNGFDGLDPSLRQVLAPVLAAAIESSRDDALERGVEPIPAGIRKSLTGHVANEILDRVRWRVEDEITTLQHGLFQLGYTNAVTLDHVIVFESEADARDPETWAHELVHVRQYRDWGVADFAVRYVTDYEEVEAEAARFRWEWARATGRVPQPLPSDSPLSGR